MFKKDGNNEIKTLSHLTYRCQYHIVFAPKYRRKEIYGKLKKDICRYCRLKQESDRKLYKKSVRGRFCK